eukprot:2420055-Pleurochrysis_carterae.AAC.1
MSSESFSPACCGLCQIADYSGTLADNLSQRLCDAPLIHSNENFDEASGYNTAASEQLNGR